MSDAQVEGAAQHGASVLQRINAAEVVPQAEGDGRQEQAAAAGAAVWHGVVAGGGSLVGHGWSL